MPVSSSVVTSYFQAIMRATPSPAQVAALSTLADTTALTNTLLGSANNSVDPLIRVYQAAFGRVPDSSGLDYWVGVYNAGGNSVASLQAITAGFAGSTEFRNAYDALDNRGYVSALYANVLGRAGDAAGIDYWVGVLGSGVARSTVLREFASSAEFKATTDSLIDSFLTAAANGTQSYSGSLLAGAGSSAGREFTLTTNVEGVSGSAGNDTIAGVLGTSATYQLGDNINGGSGTDTLNLLAASHTDGAAGIVSVDAVETINVRLLGTAANALEINAADWSGVATLSNPSSLANTILDVSGLADDTTIVLQGNTDINIGYNNTTTGATANAVLVSVGSQGTATTLGSASATNTANLDLDEANAGLVTHVNLEVRGSLNLARIDADGSALTYNVFGTGNAALVSDDNISVFNASAAQGNIDMTFEGVSDVAFTGGAGADRIRLGTTLSNLDSFNGGAGNDTIEFTIGGFTRSLNATAIETATINFVDAAGGAADFSAAASIATINLATASSDADADLAAVVSGAVINVRENNLDAVTLDFASGAARTTINFGSAGTATADVKISGLYVTDVAAVTIAAITAVSGGNTAAIATATFDDDVKSIVFSTLGGSGALEVGNGGDASIGGATSISFNAQSAANINFDSIIAGGTSLATLSVSTLGGESASATLIGVSGTALTTINLYASGAGDIELGTISLGNGSKTGEAATVAINVNQGASADVALGAIASTGGMSLALNVSGLASSGSFYIADLALSKGTDGSTTGLTQNFTLSAVTVGTAASFELEAIDLEGATAGAQIRLGNITVKNGGAFDLGSASAISADGVANVDISNITLSVEASGSATFGVISTNAGEVGPITVTVGNAASATFGAISASAVGAVSVVANGSTGASAGGVDFGAITAEASIGAITIGGSDAQDVTFGAVGASGTIGDIRVSGALDVTFGTITATRIGEVNNQQQGVSGAFTVDLSGVANAIEVKLGAASNVVISGQGNDVITLLGGRTSTAGNDVIRFTQTAQGTDSIVNFIAGAAASGGDQIEIGTGISTATLMNADGEAILNADAADLTAVITDQATSLVATDNIFVIGTAMASTAAMLDFFDGLALTTAAQASSTFVVAWMNGSDTYVTLVDAIGAGSAAATTLASGGHTLSTTTLAVLQGVSAGALAAANFDFI